MREGSGIGRPGLIALAALTVAIGAVLAAKAPAVDLAGYDGSNPFVCEIQDVGTGTDFPDPDADPFCVRYDKSEQNVNHMGIAEFLAGEPVRLAAAADKCFYYQQDHWRGSLIEEEPLTETYHWEGAYFFDKAKGEGGVFAENFTVNQQTVDPTLLPGFPDSYRPYFGEGRGGVRIADGVPLDPRCVALAESEDVYPEGRDPDQPDAPPRHPEQPEEAGEPRRPSDGSADRGRSAGDAAGFREDRRSPRFTG